MELRGCQDGVPAPGAIFPRRLPSLGLGALRFRDSGVDGLGLGVRIGGVLG